METIELFRNKFGDDIFTYTEPEPLVDHSRHTSHHQRRSKASSGGGGSDNSSSTLQVPSTAANMGLGHVVSGDSFLHSACRTGCLGRSIDFIKNECN
jgi:hypothetical protein